MTAAAAPPLAPDLAAGLRRLKLAAIRQFAPELLVTAKTQRWAPSSMRGPARGDGLTVQGHRQH